MFSLDKKAPVVRFKGFEDDWEQRKLGDITESYSGGTPSASNKTYYGGNIPFVRSGEINDSSTELFVTEEGLNNSSAKMVTKGDILYALYGATSGEVGISQINGAINQAILAIRPTKGDDSYLISQWLKKQKDVIISTYLQGGQGNLSGSIVKNLHMILPSDIDEQRNISTFFKSLDGTIVLHQRKLETLMQLKKGFLQKLFPKNQENVPEIRFANFQAEWEQRKLDEISDKVTEKNINNEFTETLTNSAEYGIINQREFFDKDISNKKNLNGYYVVRKDDFVYNPRISNYAPVGPIKRNKLGRTGVMSPLYYIFRTHNIDKTFLEYYFDTTIWHRFMKLQGDSGARADRFAIKDSVFKTMPIPSPSIEEQEKIGCIFKVIDDTVALHQKKLEQLQLLKSGLLQKMFI